MNEITNGRLGHPRRRKATDAGSRSGTGSTTPHFRHPRSCLEAKCGTTAMDRCLEPSGPRAAGSSVYRSFQMYASGRYAQRFQGQFKPTRALRPTHNCTILSGHNRPLQTSAHRAVLRLVHHPATTTATGHPTGHGIPSLDKAIIMSEKAGLLTEAGY